MTLTHVWQYLNKTVTELFNTTEFNTATDARIAAAAVTLEATELTYEAIVTQTSTNAPTVVIQKNELGAEPVMGYTSAGLFTATLAGAFTVDKTSATLSQSVADTTTYAVRTSADVITFGSAVGNTGVATNGKIAGSLLTIKVKV